MRILRQSPLEENNGEMLTNRKGCDFPIHKHTHTSIRSVHSVSRVAAHRQRVERGNIFIAVKNMFIAGINYFMNIFIEGIS